MSFEWKKYTIADVSKNVVTGKTPPGTLEKYFGGDVLFVTPTDMGDNKYIERTQRTLSDEGEAKLAKQRFECGIVVSCIGWQMGKSAIVKNAAVTNQQINTIIPNNEIIDTDFLYYILSDKRTEIFNLGATATRTPILKKSLFEKIEFYAPKLEQQKKIGNILSCLDDKIINNRKINQTLEQMAQTLFKSWFVDFEPVKAKITVLESGGSQEEAMLAAMTAISGKDVDALMVFEHEHPEQYAELKVTADLFPSAMQDSELGEIPEGWCHGPLSDIATFANGKVDVCSLTPETYISTENMLENRAGISTASSLPSVNSVPEFRCGHVLISNIRPYFKKIWLARFKGGRSADVLAFEARDSVNVEYVYNLLYQEVFFNFMMLTSKGVKMPRGDKKAIMDWQCVHPDKKISNAFSKAVGEYYSFIEINNAQNKTLTQLRDTLLPKLLSGEITLPEVEQAIGEVENV
ncbi:restriction endonuclease subunit S [Serratia sp. SRS-8-S-2018]|uniref:restriction endonuclease subunit S n=1 Tax=Serratia TaxID=613 RepID=UPI0009787EAC|nr:MULTISPECIES: restriction endonuclease subunit S [Serratia]EIT7183372.1 restriction endonuclease subunit S [Serratia marcescens]EJC6394392.1 restriction endonuclease subunit S [Serratia marcescens]OMP54007.1 restriction endonuclease [Serratia marcescens]RZF16168.1 restriction endonuclease [Serratia marcescens]TPW50671.1 restriction endonuclease subunit S [Serratia sp. SRS-8-S-2018]